MVMCIEKYQFIRGESITLNDDNGWVNFISNEYITMTTNRWKDDNYMTGYRETNLLVYPTDFKNIIFNDRKINEEKC